MTVGTTGVNENPPALLSSHETILQRKQKLPTPLQTPQGDANISKKRFKACDPAEIVTSQSQSTVTAMQERKKMRTVDILDDMKFMSLDLRKQLRSLEKSIASMEVNYLQNSYSLDGHMCNLLSGFSSNICLKSISHEAPVEAELKADQLRQKRIALTRSLLTSAGTTHVAFSRLSDSIESLSSTSSTAASVVQYHQCLFSMTSLSSPIMSQLAIRKA